jgi:5'-3' exonuclease
MMRHADNSRGGRWNINVHAYKNDYHRESFGKSEISEVCHQYIQGLQWVITYYTTGCGSWDWMFPYQYAPMASTMSEHVDSFVPLVYPSSKPAEPFEQLLSVLPPKSAHLLPRPLDTLLTDCSSELRKFCPDKIKIDLAGKRREWEGITLLPMVEQQVVLRSLSTKIEDVNDVDMTRNIKGYVMLYEAE